MPETPEPPLLNPVLTLQMDPRPEPRPGGGKDASKIVTSRLQQQQESLAGACEQIYRQRAHYPTYAGKVHLIASMFDDSFAPSHTPRDLFHEDMGCRLVAPFTRGYLIEATVDYLPLLAGKIGNPNNTASRVDISRVENLNAFDQKAVLRGREIDQLWDKAPEFDEGRLFAVRFTPFHDGQARRALLETIDRQSSEGILLPVYPVLRLPPPADSDAPSEQLVPVATAGQTSIARALRTYRNTGFARATVIFRRRDALAEFVASGASYRIDPVRPLNLAAPGEGVEPGPAAPDVAGQPIVAVVDGGLTSSKYKPAEAWAAPPFVADGVANGKHGNRVSSLVVHGHQWNNNRPLPELNCRLGTVQAVPRDNANHVIDFEQLANYLAQVAGAHPDTHIWNISANTREPEDDPDQISDFGDSLTRWARSLGVLPVVSVGNVSPSNSDRLCAPADCEAALVVGGRLADDAGNPESGCPNCLPGPGPDGMLKPDLSWFSTLRVIGGGTARGSSYATPLVSGLAAHTFANLKEPTPDLVRALLINLAEQEAHKARLGWGTPYHGHLPWNCAPGTVTLAWKAALRPGTAYYWSDIPIPSELTRGGKLFGQASLTAILNPLVSPFGGPNYFASRLETSLQYKNGRGTWASLLGSMRESSTPEQDARREFAKWQPVRRTRRDFTKKGGLVFSGDQMRLYGRVFTRDLYQFGIQHHSQLDAQEVVFVLTFVAAEESAPIYNTMAQELGNYVESAVVGQEIEIES